MVQKYNHECRFRGKISNSFQVDETLTLKNFPYANRLDWHGNEFCHPSQSVDDRGHWPFDCGLITKAFTY